MKELTLKEVCEKYNISRRAVQGYESNGLVSPTGKTDRGYLLYDENAQKQIAAIKRCQSFGLTLKEIKILFESSKYEVKEILEEKLEELIEEKKELSKTINELKSLIKKL